MARKKYSRKSSYIDPVLSRGIISIVLIVVAVLILLSFFEKAGVVGIIINDYILSSLFGSIRFTTPFILLAFAWFIIKDMEYNYRSTHIIGAVLFFLAASGLFHIGFETSDMWRQAIEGHGGGVFGMSAWLLKAYLGTIAGVIILLGFVMVSVLLIFNTSVTHFIILHKKMFGALGFVGRSVFNLVKVLFVPQKSSVDTPDKNSFGEEEFEEEEKYDDEEVAEDEPKRRGFFAKGIGHNEADGIDENEDEKSIETKGDEVEAVGEIAFQGKFPNAKSLADEAFYMQNVIIKAPPSFNLLSSKRGKPTSGDIEENSAIITDTFKQFKIETEVVSIRIGPSVTQYAVKPAKGVKLSRITALNNNLALNLAAHPIRIEAPIPGKSLVGIEVPNQKVARVTLKELLESPEYTKREHNMMLALGKDVAGKTWFMDLTRLPHLLVAGATGSGKTVCVNTILLSLLFQNTAETLRLILVDPKRVELTHYNGIPHLLTPVITNVGQTVNALKWCISEMDRRFEVLSQAGNRDIQSYNQKHPKHKLPHIVFIIDELADLMASAGNQVEPGIIKLAQMARAVGIHLILATQRPSVDVITGLMKANIPGRIAFSVASLIDSRTILDASGAEKLLGRGDMLIQTAELSRPVRLQGAFVSEEELQGVTNYLRSGEKASYDESIVDKQAGGGTMNMFGGPSDDQDPMFNEAKQAILEAGKASASFLQRRLKIGYARAARILDELEAAGIIGPGEGAKPREILTTEVETETSMGMGQEFNVFNQPRRYSEETTEPSSLASEEFDDEPNSEQSDDVQNSVDSDDLIAHQTDDSEDETESDNLMTDEAEEPLESDEELSLADADDEVVKDDSEESANAEFDEDEDLPEDDATPVEDDDGWRSSR